MRTRERIIRTTCSDTLMLLLKVTSATVMPLSIAAWRLTWSEPIAGRDGELQVRSLGHALGGEVGGPERLGDDDLGVEQLALEGGVGTVLVGGDDEVVALAFEKGPKAELSRHAAQELARGEVERRAARAGTGPRDSRRGPGCRRVDRRSVARRRDPGRARTRSWTSDLLGLLVCLSVRAPWTDTV